MCGISGLAAPGPWPREELIHVIRRMGFRQYHRGPDEWGEWSGDGVVLGHNRLAILDIEHGKQPMPSPDGSIQVVFNGEIYNYRELWDFLKKKGYRFLSDHSDTEVIVHGYQEWGTGVFEKLRGMFAIAVWDRKQRQLVLARDRLGIKPLYYSILPDGHLVFASEPKAILASGMIRPSFNESQLPAYFTFRAPRAPDTLIHEIKKIPAASFAVWKTARLEPPVFFWAPKVTAVPFLTAEHYEEAAETLLDETVLSHAISDVPVGIFLSGGTDSSLVAALLSRHQPIKAFNIGTDSPLDERPFAQKAAEQLGIELVTRTVTAGEFLERFQDWAYFNDDPVADPSALALMVLAEYARSHGIKVMLAGEGADELFAGYNAYFRYLFFQRICRWPFVKTIAPLIGARRDSKDGDYLRMIPNLRYLGTGHLTTFSSRRKLFSRKDLSGAEDPGGGAFSSAVNGSSPLREAMIFDQQVRLPNDVLMRTDRATMSVALEARVPFLDHHVVEFANNLPDCVCADLKKLSGKLLLKRILSKYVSHDIIYRPKRGFDLPVSQWLAEDFGGLIEDFLQAKMIATIDYQSVSAFYLALRNGRGAYAPLIWAWMVLEQWYRAWICRKIQIPAMKTIEKTNAYDLLKGNEGALTA